MYQYKLAYPVFAPQESDEAGTGATYGTGSFLGEAMTVGMTVQENSAQLYGDDGMVANVTAFKQCDISLGVTKIPLKVYELMFGAKHTSATSGQSTTGEKLSEKKTDAAKYGGFGVIASGEENGNEVYQLIWFKKVKFQKPTETYNTNGDSIAFGTPTLNGTAISDGSGEWRLREVYSTLETALAALKTKAGIETA